MTHTLRSGSLPDGSTDTAVFEDGTTCWLQARARAGRFLVDADAYFTDLADEMKRARRTISLLGWDLAGGLPFPKADQKQTLLEFLSGLVEENPNLTVRLLVWDYAAFFLLSRETLTSLRFTRLGHSRLIYKPDDQHPIGGSHHEKAVVIDDRVAYVGGIDLTNERWDTSDHEHPNPKRTTPEDKPYRPFHDVQVKVTGEIARAVSRHFRARWKQAADEDLPEPPVDKDPAGGGPENGDFRDALMALSRTLPAYRDQAEVQEIKNLYERLIDRAERSVYIENQYFTADTVVRKIEQSLQKESGPEFVVVLPKEATGEIEKNTLWRKRNRIFRRLKEADRGGRFFFYTARLPNAGGKDLKVHSKIMIVDDRWVTVGSANLTNRSLGLDSELNVTLDAGEAPEGDNPALALRSRLIAEHLGWEAEAVAARLKDGEKASTLIEERKKRDRRLEPIPIEREPENDDPLIDQDIVDMEETIPAERIADKLLYEAEPGRRALRERPWFQALSVAAGAALVLGVWFFTPLHRWADVESVLNYFKSLERDPASLGVAGLVFAAASFLFVPYNALLIGTASLFPAGPAFLISLGGGWLSSLAGYGAGAGLGKTVIRRLFTKKVDALADKLRRQGVIPVLLIRLLPIAPFASVNLVAGAGGVQLGPYLIGTLLGLLPGTAAIVLFQRSLVSLVFDFKWENAALVLLAGAGIGALWWWLYRRFKRTVR